MRNLLWDCASSHSNSAVESYLHFQGVCPCCVFIFLFIFTLFVWTSLVPIYLSGFWIQYLIFSMTSICSHFNISEIEMCHTVTNTDSHWLARTIQDSVALGCYSWWPNCNPSTQRWISVVASPYWSQDWGVFTLDLPSIIWTLFSSPLVRKLLCQGLLWLPVQKRCELRKMRGTVLLTTVHRHRCERKDSKPSSSSTLHHRD